jgi:hypothetical protein
MTAHRQALKDIFERGPSVFQTLAAQRTHRVFKGFSKDVTRAEVHGATGRKLESEYMRPTLTPLTWEGADMAKVEPLTELETALLLWAACGPNGMVTGDIGVNENLSTMVCMAGRTVPGPCNDAAVQMIFCNDQGTFLYRPTYHRDGPVEIRGEEDYEKVLRWFREGTIKLSDKRPDLDWGLDPIKPLGVYQANGNKPGTTCFIPVYGTAHELINVMFSCFEFMGTFFVDEETGQPAGCQKWVDDPKYNLKYGYPLKQYELNIMMTEANPPAMAIQNIRLATEALGLGSWNHGIAMDSVMGGMDAIYELIGITKGNYVPSKGLGFTYSTINNSNNYVGLPGVLQGKGLPAPWNESPEAVVREVYEDKYKAGAFFSEGTEFMPIDKGPYKPQVLEAIRKHPRTQIPEWVVDASASVVRYCFDKWGRYPVSISDFQNSLFMIEVGVVDERFYDAKNIPGFVNDRIRARSTRAR